ncbi:MAG: DUF3606 domain-containing protein [Herminiimonas sp.]|nr:DUF3606 domain-containing protein [Herminiimonas sp.]
MVDIISGRVPAEPGKVDVSEIWELEYWMGVFAVSEEQLRGAVDAVGSDSQTVKAFFERARDEQA